MTATHAYLEPRRCADCQRPELVDGRWHELNATTDGRLLCAGCFFRAPDSVASSAPASGSPSPPTTNVGSEREAADADLSGTPSPQCHPSPGPDPVFPTGSVEKSEEAELDCYLRQYAAGELSPLMTPIEVELPALPPRATAAMRAVADDFTLVLGLRLAGCNDEPVPYGAAWVAKRLGLARPTVSKVRAALERAGVLRFCGELPARGKRNGTRTYLPGFGPPDGRPHLREVTTHDDDAGEPAERQGT
jgi:hypothetical protein